MITTKAFIEEISQPFPREVVSRNEHERQCKWLAHQLYVKVIRGPRSGVLKQFDKNGAMTFFSEKPKDAVVVITNRSF